MVTLAIEGLKKEGAGDIVGAFVNKAYVSPDSIGDITIYDTHATVEVSDDVAEEILSRMDGEKIGGSKVSLKKLTDQFSKVRSYTNHFTQLVEYERKEEMDRHKNEMQQMSGAEREESGRALLNLSGRDQGEGLGGYRVKFVKQKRNTSLPDCEMNVGDLVMISKTDPLRDDNPTGTVMKKTNYSITVVFHSRPAGFVFGNNLRMDLYVNDITYQRMKESLETCLDPEDSFEKLRNIIAGVEKPTNHRNITISSWRNSNLNPSQKEAVERAIRTDDFHLIHGPPGTGKTTTLVECIQQCILNGESVLATAASNTAVDNLLEFLKNQDVDVLRVGHPARVVPSLQNMTVDIRIKEYVDYERSQNLRDKAFERLEMQDDYTYPSGKWRRGLSNEEIIELAEAGRSSRGLSPDKIKDMAEWIKLQNEADELFEMSDKLEDQAIRDLLSDVDVVCTTNASAGGDILNGWTFDTLFIDEATQATEPSCLIPMTRANRVIMAGDHKQLPPTILSKEAAEEGLNETLFQRLAEEYSEIVSLLSIQYRMNETIMNFPSEEFYDGKLIADETVRDHALNDFGLNDVEQSSFGEIIRPQNPLVFVDTVQRQSREKQTAGSSSRENPLEADLARDIVERFFDYGISKESIAVIAPYLDQVDRIEDQLNDPEIEIDTVDGFQGREKEIVIVSLVRSNEIGDVGFLTEDRRFNVALTRAKRKAIVIGDSSTISQMNLFRDFIGYSDENARIVGI